MWELEGREAYSCHPHAYSSTQSPLSSYTGFTFLLPRLVRDCRKNGVKNNHEKILRINYLINPGRPGLDEQVEGGGDEGEADVLDNLGLVRGNGDGALLQINLKHQTQICSNTS